MHDINAYKKFQIVTNQITPHKNCLLYTCKAALYCMKVDRITHSRDFLRWCAAAASLTCSNWKKIQSICQPRKPCLETNMKVDWKIRPFQDHL